ncbi:MAG: hypothetical protein J6Y08_11010 [Clostridiales bacterium]|nr:hypothetical protein [Clostridiales bacterium]
MAQAVKVRSWEEIDAMYGHAGSDYDGLNLMAFDDGEAERYMSALEQSGATLTLQKEERRKKIRQENKRAVEEAYGNFRKKTVAHTVKRLRDFFLVTFAIVFVSSMFGLLVYNEAQIASMNFANNKTERQINKMRQETSQLRESLSGSADLESIRKLAGLRLGMVEPNDKQVVNVVMPNKDHMTTSISYNSLGITDEMLTEAKRDLARYYAEEDA